MLGLKKLRKHLSRIRTYITRIGDVPLLTLSADEEEAMIDGFVQKVIRWKMFLPAVLFSSLLVPGSVWFGQIVLTPAAPVLELFGIDGYKYAAFFNSRDSVKRLMDRLEKLNDRQT